MVDLCNFYDFHKILMVRSLGMFSNPIIFTWYMTLNHIYKAPLTIHFIIDFKPLSCCLFLDGRHRYIEAEAFSLNKKLPVIHLHSDEIISALVDLNSFLNYIIVRNIKVFYDCVFGGKSMRPLLQFSDFGVYI